MALAQQQVESLTSRLATAEQSLGGDLRNATENAAKYKKRFKRTNKKLKVNKPALEYFSKVSKDHLREHQHAEDELRRLRSDLADRDTKVDRLQNQMFDWNQMPLAVRDRDAIRAHLVQVGSGDLHLPLGLISAASANPPTRK